MNKERNNIIAKTIRSARKELGMTQKQFSFNSGLGLRFIREIEQGKQTVRMDKVIVALNSLGYDLRVVPFERIR